MIHAVDSSFRRTKRFLKRWNYNASQLRAVNKKSGKAILVYQMGKVGSTSIHNSLVRSGAFSLHFHSLSRSHLPFSGNWPPYYNHMVDADFARKRLLGRSSCLVITGTRDPIKRNISAFFQGIRKYGFAPESLSEADVPTLENRFLEAYDHTLPITWFDREIRRHLGVDVYENPFVGDALSINGDIPILILKTEADDATKISAIESFTGYRIDMERGNVGEQKNYAKVYRAFQRHFKPPQSMIDLMYGSRFANHFYSSTEIDDFVKYWSK